MRIPNRERGHDGPSNDVERLVARRDEHVDGKSGQRRRRLGVRQADRREQERQHPHEAGEFGREHEPRPARERRVDGAGTPGEIRERRHASQRDQRIARSNERGRRGAQSRSGRRPWNCSFDRRTCHLVLP